MLSSIDTFIFNFSNSFISISGVLLLNIEYLVISLSKKIDKNTQKVISFKLMKQMEFNFDFGRLDKSVHLFCIGSNDDVRITTRYDENYFLSSVIWYNS